MYTCSTALSWSNMGPMLSTLSVTLAACSWASQMPLSSSYRGKARCKLCGHAHMRRPRLDWYCLAQECFVSALGCMYANSAFSACMLQLKGKKSPFAPSPDEPQRYASTRLSKRGSSGDLQKRGSVDSTTWQSVSSRQVSLPALTQLMMPTPCNASFPGKAGPIQTLLR